MSPASWWAQLPEVSGHFDAACAAEGLSDLITPKIPSPLLRQEAHIAAEVVVRHLAKPQSPELAERHSGDDSGTTEAAALCHALQGRWAEAAAQAESFVGVQQLLKVFIRALRLEQFDEALTARLLRAGQDPATAVRAGLAVGRHGWWPTWLLKIVSERALAGTRDE